MTILVLSLVAMLPDVSRDIPQGVSIFSTNPDVDVQGLLGMLPQEAYAYESYNTKYLALPAKDIIIDGHIATNSATGSSCPSSTFTKVTSDSSTHYMGRAAASTSSSSCQRGYVEFSVDNIEDGISIQKVYMTVGSASGNSNPRNVTITSLTNQPSLGTVTAQQVWDDIGNGPDYVTNIAITTLYDRPIDLGSQARSDLQAAIGSQSWWAFGLKFQDETRDSLTHAVTYAPSDMSIIVLWGPSSTDEDNKMAMAYRANILSGYDYVKYREWDGDIAGWSPEVEINRNLGDSVVGTDIAISPLGTRAIGVEVDNPFSSTVQSFALLTCPADCTLPGNWDLDIQGVGMGTQEAMQIEYEGASGDLLMVYDTYSATEADDFKYRVLFANGTLTGVLGYDFDPGSGNDNEMIIKTQLIPRNNTNQILMTVVEGANTIRALIWDGDTDQFTNQITFTTAADVNGGTSSNQYMVDGVWETLSGDALLFTHNNTNTALYAEFSGGSWSSVSVTDPNPVVAQSRGWFHLAPHPQLDKVMACSTDSGRDLYCAEWSGSSLGTWTMIFDGTLYSYSTSADFVWNKGGSGGVVVYQTGVSGDSYLRYKTLSGSTWSGEKYLQARTAGASPVQAYAYPLPGTTHALFLVDSGFTIRYNGDHTSESVIHWTDQFTNYNPDEAPGLAAASIAVAPIRGDGGGGGEGSVAVQIALNMASGHSTPQTAGTAFTITCSGGGGNHDGNPSLQTFGCDPSETVTVSVPVDTSTSRFRFSDGSPTKSFEACGSGMCSSETYNDIMHQFNVTLTISGIPDGDTVTVTRTQLGSEGSQEVGNGNTTIWVDQGSSVVISNPGIVGGSITETSIQAAATKMIDYSAPNCVI